MGKGERNTEKFIKHLFAPGAPVCVTFGIDNTFHDEGKPKSMFFRNIDDETAQDSLGMLMAHCSASNFRRHQGIFFTVNQTDGKWRSTENITGVNALYAEFDCKDEQDIAKTLYYLSCKEHFPIEPTAIVRSKNGPHVYWKVSDISVDEFDKWQDHLYGCLKANGFNPDPASRNINRILRLPGFDHKKDINNPFFVELYKCIDKSYSKSDLEVLTKYQYAEGKSKNTNKKTKQVKEKSYTPTVANLVYNNYINKYYNIFYIYSLCSKISIDTSNSLLTEKRGYKYYFTLDNFLKFIKGLDILSLMGIKDKGFRCFFHPDRKKSGSYFRGKSGDYIYTCFSSHCEMKGSINNIQLLAQLCGITEAQVITAFKTSLKVVTAGKLIADVKTLHTFNKQAIASVIDNPAYPAMNKVLAKHRSCVEFLIDYIGEKCCTEYMMYNDKPGVFLSNRWFGFNNGGMNLSIANKTFNYLAGLGFMRKLRYNMMPLQAADEAVKLRRRMEQTRPGEKMHEITFYSMGLYTEAKLKEIEANCRKYLKAGITKSSMSQQTLADAIGYEELKNVYYVPNPPADEEKKYVAPIQDKIPSKNLIEALFSLDYESEGGNTTLDSFKGPLDEYGGICLNRGAPVEDNEWSLTSLRKLAIGM